MKELFIIVDLCNPGYTPDHFNSYEDAELFFDSITYKGIGTDFVIIKQLSHEGSASKEIVKRAAK